MSIVVDASVAAKWFLREHDSLIAYRLLNGTQPLVAPELLRAEVAAAISRRARLGAIDDGDARQRFDASRATLAPPTLSLVADDALLECAFEIAVQLKHPLQDCLYIACAEGSGAELVTADPKLVRRAAPAFSFVRAL